MNNEVYTTVIKLNAEEAQNNLKKLEDKISELKKKKEEAFSNGKTAIGESIAKDLNKAQREMKAFANSTMNTKEVLDNLGKANLGQLEKAAKDLRREFKATSDPEQLTKLQEKIDAVTARMDRLKNKTEDVHDIARKLSSTLSNIPNASANDLLYAKSHLQGQLNGLNPNSDMYQQQSLQLREVDKQLGLIKLKQEQNNTLIAQYDRELSEARAKMEDVKIETQLVNNTLSHLSTASVRDLEYSIKILNQQMRGLDRGTKEFKAMEEQAKKLKTELQNVRYEGAAQQSWINRTADWFNKMQGVAISLFATFAGLSMTIRKCIEDFAAMDQEMTNVQKYTGQTKQQVEKMNETFKSMDTRTPREKLNQLAGDAGRLGINTEKMVEEFVDGADKINVALGDDLGDDAVKNIGKLAMMFGEDKKKGLRGAMLATGSAVNELSQNSSASAGYLVDFTARLSGVGKQANLTQTQIMGFGAVLDQNMQQDETAATAMQGLITKMFQNPAKFAKLAGQSVKEFTNLLKTDANSALLKFFAAMKQKGGFAELAPMFDSMKMDGARATGVLSVMADKLADVKKAQALANKSYSDGTSVIKEFNTQMSSEQARLDMRKKQFKEYSILLGKELLPVMRYAISTAGVTIKTLIVLVQFVKQHISGLIQLTLAITALTIVYKAGTIYAYMWLIKEEALLAIHKASVLLIRIKIGAIGALKVAYYYLTGQTVKAKEAMEAMKVASVTNPWTALLAVILAVAAGVYYLIKAINAHNKAIQDNLLGIRKSIAINKDMTEAQKEVNANTAEEKTRLERLTNIINSNVYSYGERKSAMIALEKIVPGYHRNLNNEATLTQANNTALKEYVDRLNDAAMAQALYNRMVSLNGKKFDLEAEIKRHNYSAKAVKAEINRHSKYYNSTEDKIVDAGDGIFIKEGTFKTDANRGKHDELQHWIDASKRKSDELTIVNARRKNITDFLRNDKGVREQYDNITINNKPQTAELIPPTGGGGTDVDPKEAEKAKKARDAAERKREAARKKKMNNELKAAKDETDMLQAQNMLAYNTGEETQRERIDKQHQIAIDGYDKRINIYKKYKEDYRQLEDDKAKEELEKENSHNKFIQADIEANYQKDTALAKAEYSNKDSAVYHDQTVLNERLFEADMSYMADKLAAMKDNSEEWLELSAEMQQRELEHKYEQEEYYDEMLSQYREEWGKKDIKSQEKIALDGLDHLHEVGLLKEAEYQDMRKKIQLEYALQESEDNLQNSKGVVNRKEVDLAYQIAHNNAEAGVEDKNEKGTKIGNYITSDIKIFGATWKNIKEMEKNGVLSHEQAMAAMSKATGNFAEGLAAKMQAAYDSISTITNALSSYYSSQSDYEVAVTEKKYGKLITAAGNNTQKTKKLEEQKEKEVAKIKTKYAHKQASMQVAQAIAQTAISAIAAYGSAMSGVPYPANLVLAPVAAGIALAAGALQIATIKKQQQAQDAGYYDGGFTPGKDWHNRAGIVHQDEFVANHKAVNNPNVRPFLNFIDTAQRNNTIGGLTALDVSRTMGSNTTVVSAPVVNVDNNSSELQQMINESHEAISKLTMLLAAGIHATVAIDGNDGVKKNLDRYNNLMNNK